MSNNDVFVWLWIFIYKLKKNYIGHQKIVNQKLLMQNAQKAGSIV